MSVAQTILEQLGGRAFAAMTGANNFMGDKDSLTFRLPGKPGFVKDGINRVRIVLTGRDDYNLEFYRVRGANLKLIGTAEGVYCEMLREVFRDRTGLETRLPRIMTK